MKAKTISAPCGREIEDSPTGGRCSDFLTCPPHRYEECLAAVCRVNRPTLWAGWRFVGEKSEGGLTHHMRITQKTAEIFDFTAFDIENGFQYVAGEKRENSGNLASSRGYP